MPEGICHVARRVPGCSLSAMRASLVAAVVVLGVPSLVRADGDVSSRALVLGAGGGVMFGGDVSDGYGGRGQGNAGILLGVRGAWTPLRVGGLTLGPDATLARWNSEIDAVDDSLGLLGVRVQGDDRAGLYVAARTGMWLERDRAVFDGGFGWSSHLGQTDRVRIGWEIGVTGWRENNVQSYAADGATPTARAAATPPARSSTPPEDDTYPFVAVHGWFELAVDL